MGTFEDLITRIASVRNDELKPAGAFTSTHGVTAANRMALALS